MNSSEVRAADDDAIRLVDVTKRFGARTILDAVSLTVHKGEIYGLVGDNGAGKTTTIRLISGLMRPSSGRIEILGVRSDRLQGRRLDLGVTIEEPRFYPWLTGLDNLRLLANLVDASIDSRQLDAVADRVGLAVITLRRPVREYSQGMRQRLALAAALAHEPSILVLDEPSNSLDPKGIWDLHELLRNLNEEGRTILVSSHLLSELDRMCHRVGLMVDGRLVVVRTADPNPPSNTEVTVLTGQGGSALSLLAQAGIDAVGNGDTLLVPGCDPHIINQILVLRGIGVTSLRSHRQSLGEWFLEESARHAS